jgi:hypothetical protein
MISPILAKLYGIILEKKISIWLEIHGKRAKGQARFRRYHSTVDHLVTFRIIAEEFCNAKTNLFCCFVDFRKAFDMVPRKNLWNRLEEIKVPLELRAAAIRMYENVIAKFKNIEGWSKEINCNIGVKQGCPLSPTLFGIYIDKLEECLEKEGCVGPTLTGIVINLLLYVDDIVLMARSPHDLENQLRILKDFCSNMGMTVNTYKTKVMIIKSNKIPYDTFVYDNNNLEEVNSYKYLGIIALRKGLLGDGKLIMGLKTIVNQMNFGVGIRRNSYLRLLLHLLFFMDVKYGAVVNLVNPGERWSKYKRIL